MMNPRILKSCCFTSDEKLCDFINRNNIKTNDILKIIRSEGLFYLFYYKESSESLSNEEESWKNIREAL